MDINTYKNIRSLLNFEKPLSYLFRHVVIDILIIASFIYLSKIEGVEFWLGSQLLLTVFFFRSFGMMHDCVHQAIAKSPAVNRWAGYLYGAFCLLPYEGWRDIHLKHHLWSSNVDKDPTMALIKNYDPNKYRQNVVKNIIWKSWMPILAFLQYVVFWNYNIKLVKQKITKGKSIKAVVASALVPLAIYGYLFYFHWNIFNVANTLPALVAYFVMVEVINFPHHLGLPSNYENKRLAYKDQHQISRSCYYPRWFARTVLLNFNYHIEHHMYPDLPWHQLDKARALIRPNLGREYNDVKGNEWIIENRKMKLDELILSGEVNPADQANEAKVA